MKNPQTEPSIFKAIMH